MTTTTYPYHYTVAAPIPAMCESWIASLTLREARKAQVLN